MSHGDIELVRGDCLSGTDNGVFVDGTVNSSAGATLDSTNDTLSFYYTPDGSSGSVLFNAEAPNPTSASYLGLNVGGFGFGSPQYAAGVFSQAYNSTRAVTNPINIAGFYVTSAATGAAGLALPDLWAPTSADITALTTKLTSFTTGLVTASYFIAQNPDYWGQATDFLNSFVGKDFGPIPATWGGIRGAQAGIVKDLIENAWDKVQEEVPH